MAGSAPRPRTAARLALLLLCAAAVVWLARRAPFAAALHLISRLPWTQVTGLTVLWLAGLCVHTVVLVASMPGLTHGRALVLNLSGSAVSNVLPLGGVAGTALNLTMTRSWGHGSLDVARFVVVSNAVDVIAKLTLPAPALAWLVLSGALSVPAAGAWALPVLAALAAGLLLTWAIAGRTGPLLRLAGFLTPKFRTPKFRLTVRDLLAGTDRLVRDRRAALSGGMAGYWLAQGALLWGCLLAVGVRPGLSVVFGALVAERFTTLLPITPGGAGPAETSMVAALVALGIGSTGALAGVLLFRAFVFAAEIPAGAVVILCWWLARRLRDGKPPACA